MDEKDTFVLNDFLVDVFKKNAAHFNDAESETHVIQRHQAATLEDGSPSPGSYAGRFLVVDAMELPVMENPKHFFRFFRGKRLQMLFDRCPEEAAKLGTRPWKYILKYSPEYADQCPCWKEFSEEEKQFFLSWHPRLKNIADDGLTDNAE